MIRHFDKMDLRRLKSNRFHELDNSHPVFDDPNFYKKTMVGNNSTILAIICFTRYWGNCFAAFFIVSDDLRARGAIELKTFIYQAALDLQADRVQTDSEVCPELTRWHKFLGFKSEGVREKMLNNKDYEMWAILKGRDF